MTTILGIDAAWTPTNPSGVALIKGSTSSWDCVAVAPSYASFLALSTGSPVNWSAPPTASLPDPRALLVAARTLAGAAVDIVTIDMPVSTHPYIGRRKAEQLVSTEFGARHCATHSSTANRPGILGSDLSSAFRELDYPIATDTTPVGTLKRLVEVYPHPALLALLNRPLRLRYKASNSTKYWPGMKMPERLANLLGEYRAIEQALRSHIAGISLTLPTADSKITISGLKRYEDALDALVCCWVGVRYMSGNAVPFGDETAAIWCPTRSVDLPPVPPR
jgi:predicted RNase H-like nuclease